MLDRRFTAAGAGVHETLKVVGSDHIECGRRERSIDIAPIPEFVPPTFVLLATLVKFLRFIDAQIHFGAPVFDRRGRQSQGPDSECSTTTVPPSKGGLVHALEIVAPDA